VSYTILGESGASYVAAGWTITALCGGGATGGTRARGAASSKRRSRCAGRRGQSVRRATARRRCSAEFGRDAWRSSRAPRTSRF
jgi:hypothetical protein